MTLYKYAYYYYYYYYLIYEKKHRRFNANDASAVLISNVKYSVIFSVTYLLQHSQKFIQWECETDVQSRRKMAISPAFKQMLWIRVCIDCFAIQQRFKCRDGFEVFPVTLPKLLSHRKSCRISTLLLRRLSHITHLIGSRRSEHSSVACQWIYVAQSRESVSTALSLFNNSRKIRLGSCIKLSELSVGSRRLPGKQFYKVRPRTNDIV